VIVALEVLPADELYLSVEGGFTATFLFLERSEIMVD